MAVATEYATGRRKCAIARAWVTGTAGDITVNDKYTPMFPIHFAGLNSSDGTYHITATAGMRTQ